MSVQSGYNTIENELNNSLEALLNESRHEMRDRTQSILRGIDSHAIEAKKDVHHHITQFVKVKSTLSRAA